MNEAKIGVLNSKKTIGLHTSDVIYNFTKRSFDIVVSFISLILLSPLFLITVILIRKDSKGKAIFKQKRIGKNGNPIYIYKFRSMILNAEEELERLMKENPKIKEEYLKNKKLKDDPRITKVGKVIRKTSIDELPQLINILKGDMSFVGPRPYLYREIPDMDGFYDTIITMKPGLTGLWQVSGRSDVSFEARLDKEYSIKRSLMYDLKILFKTFKVVFLKKGAK